jgi:hypothetical protein
MSDISSTHNPPLRYPVPRSPWASPLVAMVPKLFPRALAIRQAHLQHVPRPPSPAPPLPSFVCVDSTNTKATFSPLHKLWRCNTCPTHPSTQRTSSLPDTLAACHGHHSTHYACPRSYFSRAQRAPHPRSPPMAKTTNFQMLREMPLQILSCSTSLSLLSSQKEPCRSRPVAHTPIYTTSLWCSVLSRRTPLPTSLHDAVCEPPCAGDSWHARRPTQGRTTGHVQSSCQGIASVGPWRDPAQPQGGPDGAAASREP